MKKPSLYLTLTLSFLLCCVTAFSGCSTGTKPGDTNVESGNAKDKDAKAGHDKQGEGTSDNESGADR